MFDDDSFLDLIPFPPWENAWPVPWPAQLIVSGPDQLRDGDLGLLPAPQRPRQPAADDQAAQEG